MNDEALERIAESLEVHNTLYLAYLIMAFGKLHTVTTLDELVDNEGEQE